MPKFCRNKKRDNQRDLLGTIHEYSLLFVFCISFLGQYSAALFLDHHPDNTINEGKSIVSDASGHASHFPLDFPLGIEPDGDESDKDESEADQYLCFENAIPETAFRYSIEKTSFANFISCIENRKPVSLIILHHSWKSFLS